VTVAGVHSVHHVVAAPEASAPPDGLRAVGRPRPGRQDSPSASASACCSAACSACGRSSSGACGTHPQAGTRSPMQLGRRPAHRVWWPPRSAAASAAALTWRLRHSPGLRCRPAVEFAACPWSATSGRRRPCRLHLLAGADGEPQPGHQDSPPRRPSALAVARSRSRSPWVSVQAAASA
jgi:hypothetical protein